WACSGGGCGVLELQCVDLFSNGISEAYYDDWTIELGSACGTCCPFDTLICETDCATGDALLSWTTFQPPGGYGNGIDVYRDGVLIDSIPGDATSYTDVGLPGGTYTYELFGNCDPTGSWSVSCSFAHTPAGGTVDDIIFKGDGGGLIDTATAAQVALEANGRTVLVTDDLLNPCLTAGSFSSLWVMLGTYPENHVLTAGEGQALADYSLAGTPIYIEGGDTWGFNPATAFAAYDGVDDLTAADGDDSFLSMVGLDSGFTLSMVGLDSSYNQDNAGNDWTDQIQPATTDAGGPDAGAIWQEESGAYVTGIYYESIFGKVIAQSWEFGGYAGNQETLAGFNLYGLGLIPAPPPVCLPPIGVAADADCLTGDITITWTNNDTYSGLDVLRDGTLLASLGGTETSYVDSGVPAGTYQYTVEATCTAGGTNQGSATATHAPYDGSSDVVFALQGLQTAGDLGLIDSAAALAAALTAAGRTVQVLAISPADFACLDQAEIAWVSTGSFPDDYRITLEEGDALAAANAAGTGLYFEGGDHWGFGHVVSAMDDRDGILDAFDGNDTFTAMDGLDSGAGLDMSAHQDVIYLQDQALSDWTDQITVATTEPEVNIAGAIWQLDDALGVPYVTGVAADTTTGADMVSASWEFGGYANGDAAAQQALVTEYAGYLGGGPPPGIPFIRADANGDLSVNIADPVNMLSVLFVPGTPPLGCDDAGDANSDLAFNIGDPVYVLSSLF
ncbi:MAG: hypothetical protein ACE5GW_12480, partial [Planctomycetota bacterium]